MAYRITHIRKPNVNSTVEHITHVKGYDDSNDREFIFSTPEVIKHLKNNYYFYVLVGSDKIDVTHQTSSSGNEYIKTKPDATKKDNLLNLPQF